MTEFEKFAIKDQGIGSNVLHSYQNFMSEIPMIDNSMTPAVIEERQLNATVISVFDRLMMNRLLWVARPVNDRMSTIVQAQLLFLDQQDSRKTITIHVDSPGGSVKSGL